VIPVLLALINPIAGIATEIAKYKTVALSATTDRARIDADERVRALEARRDVLIAEGSLSRLNAFMRFALALGPMLYLNKIFLWDKVLGWGRTDPLDTNLWGVVIAVVSFYFLYDIAARLRR
jgi:uncharacterized protein involved in type VI secretion and phage assembly